MKTPNVLKTIQKLKLDYRTAGNPDELILDCIDKECPKPDDHLYLNKRTGMWICHRCGITGNIVTLVSIVKKISARRATLLLQEEVVDTTTVEELKNRLKDAKELETEFFEKMGLKRIINPPPGSKKVTREKYPSFLNRRRLPFHLAQIIGTRYCTSGKYHGRVIFPFMCDKNLSFVAYSTSDLIRPKTLNPPGSENDKLIYLYDHVNKKSDQSMLIVVEGVFDCLRLLCYNYSSVALLGNYLSKDQAILLDRSNFEIVVFMLDGNVELREYKKLLKNIKYIMNKHVFFAPIPDKEDDPDTLSPRRVRQILLQNSVVAEDEFFLKERIKNLKVF
jgi:hypothetical protein